jgi:N6-L-threonylcarbamoyladenine synthase
MALIETGDSSTGVANVDSNYNLKVALPSVKEQAGFVGIAGFADDAGNVRIPIGAAAYYEYIKGIRHGYDLNAIPNLKLGERI